MVDSSDVEESIAGFQMNRRDFLQMSGFAAAGTAIGQRSPRGRTNMTRLAIVPPLEDAVMTRFAVRELRMGLRELFPRVDVVLSSNETQLPEETVALKLLVEKQGSLGRENYRISRLSRNVEIAAGSEQALAYAIFDFLERQGTVFGIDGPVIALDLPEELVTPEANHPWISSPAFSVRGLLPWPDFWNCISVYNQEDFRAYFANMVRMRMNMFGMHVYTQNDPLAESYLSFNFAGSGHHAALEDTTVTSWGYLPQRTSTFKMGAAQFYDRETFGADATRLAADNWEIADRTRELLRDALTFASQLGIRTGIGFEPYTNPAEIVRALPPESKSHPKGLVESVVGRDLLERRLADLLERYPNVDYIWLWEDETTNWNSREKNLPLSTTPFIQAHDFLRRHAPEKHLVLAGWGGIVRNFESLHQRLPGDITFAALSNTLGWDPINESFRKLEDRQRWVIPWLEDDPAMWFPQFRASHIEQDLHRAHEFGCQGVLGIHWRHRVVDPTATYLSRGTWDLSLTASDHYRSISDVYASGPRKAKLASLLTACDEQRAIVSTFLGGYDRQGYANKIELTPDYAEGFSYDMDQPPLPDLAAQRRTDNQFRKLHEEASSATERERLGYFAGFVHLMTSYCDAYRNAQELNKVLRRAVTLRSENKDEDAREIVLREGISLWLEIAPKVRESMLTFQSIIATRNDQGQLASMQNKFVRIALDRLQLSIKEFIREFPPEMTEAYLRATRDDEGAHSRVFVPTRPSVLKPGEELRIFIVVPSPKPIERVLLHTRTGNALAWKQTEATLAGRHVFQARLGSFSPSEEWIEYYASAAIRGEPTHLTAPAEPDRHLYRAVFLG